MQTAWLKKVDEVLRENFKHDELITFGTHLNVEFTGWEGLSDNEILQKLDKVDKSDAVRTIYRHN